MFARVNGCRIFFDVEGLQYVPDGPVMREKPVCLVLHGGPGADHTHFMPDLSPLSEVCQLIYIDDRNTGRSERTDVHTSSIRQNVEDIEALREYLGLQEKDRVVTCLALGVPAVEYLRTPPRKKAHIQWR